MGSVATHRTAAPADVRLLLFSDRPAVHAFFSTVGSTEELAPVTVEAARERPLDEIAAAVVDVALEPAIAVEVCRELQRRRPELPVTAVVCCPHAVTAWTLQALLASGVSAVLDLQASAGEAERLLENVSRGVSVLHLQLPLHHGQRLHDLFAPKERRSAIQARLLELVARGMSDREIGDRLYLSQHTVKHRIEYLRDELCVRNRTELAAWAGRHGFYGDDEAISASSPTRRP